MGNKHSATATAGAGGVGESGTEAVGAGSAGGTGRDGRGPGGATQLTPRALQRLARARRPSLNSLENRGGVQVGDVFVTWHSSRLKEVSYMEGTVVDIFEQEVDEALFGQPSRKKTFVKFLALQYPNGKREELSLRDLRSSVARAQQAMATEQEWFEKVRQHGLSPGMVVDLWVGASHPAPRSARPVNEPGDICTYSSVEVHVGWHYQDIVVELEVAPIVGAGGALGPVETIPFDLLKGMLLDARAAQELLEKEMKLITERDGIFLSAKVDLWIPELNTNVRGIVASIRHKFASLSSVELQPVVYYYVGGARHEKFFDTYVDFVTSWKQAKYIAEQQKLLRDEARCHGVSRGAEVCIFQPRHSSRWSSHGSSSADADVMELKFDFDEIKYLVSMRVLVVYREQRTGGATTRPTSTAATTLEDKLAMEWLQWDDLITRLRSKVVVSNINCDGLINPGKDDPYVKVSLGDTKFSTDYLTDALYPAWPTVTFVFREGDEGNRHNPDPQELLKKGQSFFEQVMNFTVYDHNRMAFRTFMGTVDFDVRALLSAPGGRLVQHTLKLGPKPTDRHPRRTIYGSITFTIYGVGPGIDPLAAAPDKAWSNPEYKRANDLPAASNADNNNNNSTSNNPAVPGQTPGDTGRNLFFQAFEEE